jgi:hypothetical protein
VENTGKRQKIYVYVDEAGQDESSKVFIVVSAISVKDTDLLRQQLLHMEEQAKTHALKWNKLKHDRRMRYITLVLERKIAAGNVFIGRYPKPVHYFYPIASVIERAVKHLVQETGERYLAIVHVDGANKKVAKELTNALRANGISPLMVKGKSSSVLLTYGLDVFGARYWMRVIVRLFSSGRYAQGTLLR